MAKELGGIGFRNTYGFNLVLLGKQGWNLLTNPYTIISKLLKDKYYPRGDFLEAKVGSTHLTLDVVSVFIVLQGKQHVMHVSDFDRILTCIYNMIINEMR